MPQSPRYVRIATPHSHRNPFWCNIRRQVSSKWCELPIIAILAAILFPVFAKAREKARQSSCNSNLKQIALSQVMYRADYDQVGTPRDTYPNPARYLWTALLVPYVKNDQLWICPSTRISHTCGTPAWSGPNTSYGYSFCDNRNAEAGILSPAELAMFADWRAVGIKWKSQTCTCSAACPWGNRWRPGTDTIPHNEGINISFTDGHSKWMSINAANDAFYQETKPWKNM